MDSPLRYRSCLLYTSLPALGVAMLLNYLGKKKMIPYFVIGFFLTTFLDLGIMAVAILGACVAVIVYYAATEKAEEDFVEAVEEAPKQELKIRLRKSELWKHWLIGLGAEVGYNYERMQASGNVLAMLPVIKLLRCV